MANVISRTQVARYLEALGADEVEIAEAAEAYEIAKARLDVGLRRYVALRDFVTERMGRSPYESGYPWPSDDGGWNRSAQRGKFRFAGMKVGDAIAEVLRERSKVPDEEWNERLMNLDELVDVLSEGGLGFPEPVGARAINAALMALVKGPNVKRNPQGNYYYVTPKEDEPDPPMSTALPRPWGGGVDPDDLPFE